jgi:hypothetical protein
VYILPSSLFKLLHSFVGAFVIHFSSTAPIPIPTNAHRHLSPSYLLTRCLLPSLRSVHEFAYDHRIPSALLHTLIPCPLTLCEVVHSHLSPLPIPCSPCSDHSSLSPSTISGYVQYSFTLILLTRLVEYARMVMSRRHSKSKTRGWSLDSALSGCEVGRSSSQRQICAGLWCRGYVRPLRIRT